MDDVLEQRLRECLSFKGGKDWILTPEIDALI